MNRDASLLAASLFGALGEPALALLADHLVSESFAAGQTVVQEGEPGDRWYLMVDGTVAVVHTDLIGHEVTLAVLGPGESFGERALLAPGPRAATVRAITPVTALSLEREALARLAVARPGFSDRVQRHVDALQVDAFLKRASPFAGLPSESLWRLVSCLRPRRVAAGETIVREGDAADSLYLVRSGEAEVHHGRRRVALLQAGDVFGEVALLTGDKRTASVSAIADTELLSLTKADLQLVVREQPGLALYFRELVQVRFPAGRVQTGLLPDPPGVADHPVAPRRGRRYWLVFLTGTALFALLTMVAAARPGGLPLYAALTAGSFIGPCLFVLYLAESNMLVQRPAALILTALIAAAVGLPMAIAIQRGAGLLPGTLGPALLIAAVEESAKMLGVLWVVRRSSLRFQMDGIVFGAAAGLGFGACETLLYGLARVDTVDSLLATLWLRSLLSPFSHATWTALVCAVLWRGRRAGRRRAAVSASGAFAVVVLIHGLWDWRPLPTPWSMGWLLLVGLASVALLRSVLRSATRDEARSVLALNPGAGGRGAGLLPRCRACGQDAPPRTHYCPRCGLALTDRRAARRRRAA